MNAPDLKIPNSNSSDVAPVRWAIVGTGAIAATFASDIPLAGNAQLDAVCSRNLQSAQTFAAPFGGARCFATMEALATDSEIDVVYLATPNHAHVEQANILLENGKHVLVEKPIATTAAQARDLSTLAEHKNLFLMEALWTLFLPVMANARNLLSSGRLGRIKSVWADLSYAKLYDPESRFFDPALGGGSLLDLGVYPLALMVNLFGPPQSIDGSWKAAPSGVDMSATMTLGYPGFSASIACGFNRDGANRFIIRGEKASLVIDAPFLKARRVFLIESQLALSLIGQKTAGRLQTLVSRLGRHHPGIVSYDAPFSGNGLQFEIQAVGEALRRGEPEHPIWPANNSAEVLKIIETIRARPPATA